MSDASLWTGPAPLLVVLALCATGWLVLKWDQAPKKTREWPRVIGGALVISGVLMFIADLVRLVAR